MSSVPPPGPAPGWGGAPVPSRPPADYLKPRRWWFVLGGGLILAALAIFATALAITLTSFLRIDATLPVDGSPHEFTIQHEPERDRALWVDPFVPATCEVEVDGQPVALEPTAGTFTKSFGSESYEVAGTFPTDGSGGTVTCTGEPGTTVQVGPRPSASGFAGGLVVATVPPILLGLAGLAVLIVTIVRTVRGRPRP